MNDLTFSPEMMGEIIARATNDADLTSSEIPNLDLYIDQILTLVAEKNALSSPRYAENHLTKTMINNYSKEGLIMPVKGKKYTKEHILQMLLIYSLKNTLSIGEIHRLLEGVYREGFDGATLCECYDGYVEMKKETRRRAEASVDSLIGDEGLDLSDSKDFCLALLGIVSYSAYLRSIAVEMLEARYPMPETAKEEKVKDKLEKEKAKEEKAKEKEKSKAKKSSKNEDVEA